VTGPNLAPHAENAATFRTLLVADLLRRGADPLAQERHPMAADAVIRASVFAHIGALRAIADHIPPADLAGALNAVPVINGFTALHDAVVRAGTAPDPTRYLEQIRWERAAGARDDIEDFTGRTQREYAAAISNPERRAAVLDALGPERATPQWNHPAIAVPNLEAAIAWYRDTFGFAPLGDIKKQDPSIGARWQIARALFGESVQSIRFVRTRAPGAPDKQILEIFEVAPSSESPPRTPRAGIIHACLIVSEVERVADRIAGSGGEVLGTAEFGGVRIIFVRDPFGNILELASSPW
jgi:catechol 2,3-dioxygenase-like lactoylglutathione lyase family enzyme